MTHNDDCPQCARNHGRLSVRTTVHSMPIPPEWPTVHCARCFQQVTRVELHRTTRYSKIIHRLRGHRMPKVFWLAAPCEHTLPMGRFPEFEKKLIKAVEQRRAEEKTQQ